MKMLICKVAGSSRSLQPLAFLPRLSPWHAEVGHFFPRTISYVFLIISSKWSFVQGPKRSWTSTTAWEDFCRSGGMGGTQDLNRFHNGVNYDDDNHDNQNGGIQELLTCKWWRHWLYCKCQGGDNHDDNHDNDDHGDNQNDGLTWVAHEQVFW